MKLWSEYGLAGKEISVVARIHKIIREANVPIRHEDLAYGLVAESDIEDCIALEHEWFPTMFSSEDDYRDMMGSDQYIVLGCFWKPPRSRAEDELKKYLIGNILIARANIEQNDLPCISAKGEVSKEPTGWQGLRNSFLNLGKQIIEITSIGVIDEARGLGIGSKLINIAMEQGRKKWPERTVGMSLHVIETSKAALSLYVKNGFVETRLVQNYYHMGGKWVAARYMLKGFARNEDGKGLTEAMEEFGKMLLKMMDSLLLSESKKS